MANAIVNHALNLRLTFLVLLLCVAGPRRSLADTLYVAAGTTAGTGTQEAPFDTIGAALAAAEEGDTIKVAAGVYPEKVVILKGQIKLKGGYTPTFKDDRDPAKNVTTIDGQNQFRPLQIGDEQAAVSKFRIDGFTIARGLADGVDGLDGKGGGILIVNDSSGKIIGCTLTDNRAMDDGGAIEKNGGGTIKIDRCVFNGNSAHDDAGAIRIQGNSSKTTIRNCVFANNSGLEKYVVQAKGATQIVNCTFVGNLSESRGIIASRSKAASTDSVVTVANCIFADNKAMDGDALLFADEESAPIEAKNCLFFNNDATGGLGDGVQIRQDGHREGDPLFVDPDNGDFRLAVGSPAIDNANSERRIKKDCDGKARRRGKAVDIGAYEFDSKSSTNAR
jgi:hypothetical protein